MAIRAPDGANKDLWDSDEVDNSLCNMGKIRGSAAEKFTFEWP